jgi:hypothetical protein
MSLLTSTTHSLLLLRLWLLLPLPPPPLAASTVLPRSLLLQAAIIAIREREFTRVISVGQWPVTIFKHHSQTEQ